MNREEQLLEFDKIKELWAEYALTETAKKKIKEKGKRNCYKYC